MGVFFATCAIHGAAIYFLATQVVTIHSPLWSALEVSFVSAEKPKEPPPPTEVPVILSDAFAERPLIEIPAPAVELGIPEEASQAIHEPAPELPLVTETAPEEGKGYGPFTKPRVISGPKHPQDRYPRASIRNKESGRTVVNLCISPEGTVQTVAVAQTSGYRRLDDAAMDMALDYVFEPAMREGKAVPVCLPYGIEFHGSRRFAAQALT